MRHIHNFTDFSSRIFSRHSLSPPVVSYLHNKGCIALCVENMQRPSCELEPLEVVEMFVTVFCFLKDSAEQGLDSTEKYSARLLPEKLDFQ